MHFGRQKPNIWKGLAAGLVGGLVATWTMTQFQEAWSSGSAILDKKHKNKESGEDATQKTAEAISKSVFRQPLSREQKEKAGPLVHYAFGTVMGGVYGLAAELSPSVTSMGGLPFGTTLFLGADEIALPVLKLSKSPAEYPASRHIYGLTSHFVWAGTAELVRRMVLRVL